jgi:transcriptional regulator with XRE-family HTH domain
MYRNAKAEMIRAGLTLEQVAEKMGITTSTLSLKLNGKSPITLIEAKLFKKLVGSDLPLEVLFDKFEEAC